MTKGNKGNYTDDIQFRNKTAYTVYMNIAHIMQYKYEFTAYFRF